jgi:nucleoside-diphosphate-sugar epimerase
MTKNKIIYQDLNHIINSKIDWSRFSGKTILISGANGFLPAYMVETLLFLYYKGIIHNTRIIALVRNIIKAKARFCEYLDNSNFEFIVQDVCEPITIDDNIDFIIHAASQASPRYYGTDPIGTLSANVLGTINLLNLAKRNLVESFLFFSSSEVYGIFNETKNSIKETDFGYIDPINVRSCYAESKRMGETICISWLQQHRTPVKIVRPFHTYGPKMSLDDGRVYSDFIAALVNNRDIIMKSDGRALRSFCYLSDATIAFFLVLLNGKDGEAYNVGNPDCEISIMNLALKLVSLFPEKGIKILKKDIQENGYLRSAVSRHCPDLAKITDLGWKPNTSINDGFYRTILSYE